MRGERRETYIVAMSKPVVIIPSQEGGVELSHIVAAVVVLVRVVQDVGGALSTEPAHQVQLQPLLHIARGAAGAGGGGDGDDGDGGDAGTLLTSVVTITHWRSVGTVLVIAAA